MAIRTTTSRRRQPRYPIARDEGACVELEPQSPAGHAVRLPLVDVSASGVSFLVGPAEVHGLTTGASLERVVVCVGSCQIRGDLVVMHVTPGADLPTCGALFYPSDDAELLKLKGLLAGMAAVRTE